MAVICAEHRLLFIMVPGTGCSAIGTLLRERFGGRWIPQSAVFRNDRKVLDVKHNSVGELVSSGALSAEEADGLIKFATIRNPFDRFVTDYARDAGTWLQKHLDNPRSYINAGPPELASKQRRQAEARMRRAREMDFEEWLLRRLELYPLSNPIEMAKRFRRRLRHRDKRAIVFPFVDGVDHLLRYETLDEDFNSVLRKVGINEYVPVPGKNPTPGKKPYQNYYSEHLRRKVEAIFSDELAEFSYAF